MIAMPSAPANPAQFNTAYDVRKFGAKMDGTDDSAALQSAIGSGEKWYIPRGLIGFEQIMLTTGSRIEGQGSGLHDVAATKTILRKLGSGSSGVITASGVDSVYIAGVAFEQADAQAGHIFDAGASAYFGNLVMENVSCVMQNPNASFLRSGTSNTVLVKLNNMNLSSAAFAAVPLIDLQCNQNSNTFGTKISNTWIESSRGSHPNSNIAPLVLIADDYGGVSAAVSFDSVVFEPGIGGAVEIRGMYAGPTFTNVMSADCQDAWPIINIKRGTNSPYGYGPSTFIGCFLHNITAVPGISCFAPTILGGWVGTLDCQGERPVVINSNIFTLAGTTNPRSPVWT